MQVRNPASRYLTLSLDMAGKRAVLAGGGRVAARKATVLREAGMELLIIAPTLDPLLAAWASTADLSWHRRPWQAGDTNGAALVIAATSDRDVNRRVALEARNLGIPVNVSDRPDEGNCRFPALLQRGSLELAISTEGRSPAAAVALRDMLAELIGEEYGEMLELLAIVREKLLTLGMPEAYNVQLVKKLLAQGLAGLLREGRQREAEAMISNLLKHDSVLCPLDPGP